MTRVTYVGNSRGMITSPKTIARMVNREDHASKPSPIETAGRLKAIRFAAFISTTPTFPEDEAQKPPECDRYKKVRSPRSTFGESINDRHRSKPTPNVPIFSPRKAQKQESSRALFLRIDEPKAQSNFPPSIYQYRGWAARAVDFKFMIRVASTAALNLPSKEFKSISMKYKNHAFFILSVPGRVRGKQVSIF